MTKIIKNKTGGRKAGTPNKLTHEYRQMLASVLVGEIEALPEILTKLAPHRRVEAIIKLMKYIVAPIEVVNGDHIDMTMLDPETHKASLDSKIKHEKIMNSYEL